MHVRITWFLNFIFVAKFSFLAHPRLILFLAVVALGVFTGALFSCSFIFFIILGSVMLLLTICIITSYTII